MRQAQRRAETIGYALQDTTEAGVPPPSPRPTPLLSPGSDSTASQSAPPTVRFDDTELLGKLAAIEGKLESQAAEMKKVAEATKPGGCCAIS